MGADMGELERMTLALGASSRSGSIGTTQTALVDSEIASPESFWRFCM